VQTIYGFLKVIAHLYFVYQNKVIRTLLVGGIDIVIQRTIFCQFIVIRQIKVDMDYISVFDMIGDITLECFKQLGLTASADSCYYLKIIKEKEK
jgi:hypothetical protein